MDKQANLRQPERASSKQSKKEMRTESLQSKMPSMKNNPELTEYQPIPFELAALSDHYVRKAELELHETPESRKEGIQHLRELIAGDKSLNGWRQETDEFILMFLRARKFNYQRALSNFKLYVRIQRMYRQMFTNIRFEEMRKTVDNKILNFLPLRCHEGCAILHIKMDNWDPIDLTVENVKRMVGVTFMTAIQNPMTQVNGYKVIFDFKGNGLKYIRHCTPNNIYTIYHGCVECVPARFKGFHIVNMQITFKIVWVLMRQFLSDKLKKRVHFHSDPKSLMKYFPKQVLPEEYGGLVKDYYDIEWMTNACSPENLKTMFCDCA